jgi:prepilin-type N-terminal cleavage/methylation domain-containing protein
MTPHDESQGEFMKKQQGFSLVELLIVVAIILVIAAIAIPNLLKARISANESSAVGSIRTLTVANIQHAAQCADTGFPAALTNLGPGEDDRTSAGIIDEVLTSGVKSDYNFAYTPGAADGAGCISTSNIVALPIIASVTGPRAFRSMQDGVIHYNGAGGACDSSVNGDPTLE